MKFSVYLKEHYLLTAIFLWLFFSIETVLFALHAGALPMVYFAFLLVSSFLWLTLMDYHKKKYYFHQLSRMLDHMDQKYMLAEKLPANPGSTENELKKILRIIGTDSNNRITYLQDMRKDQHTYLENWLQEIKNPISTAQMLLENRSIAEDPACWPILQTQLSHIEGYAEQTIFYSLVNFPENNSRLRPVKLRDIVSESVRSHKDALRRCAFQLSQSGLDTEVVTDPDWMRFILGRIIDNSIRYRNNLPSLKIYADHSESEVCLHVDDNGQGVSATELPYIFDKGFIGEKASIIGQSSGLSLYLCQKLCGRLNHDIRVDSEPDKGFCVTIVFPRLPSDTNAELKHNI